MTSADNVIDLRPRAPKRLSDLERKRRALLGELVAATGAGDLTLDVLAGVLLAAAETDCRERTDRWRRRGRAFFAQEEVQI